MHFRDLIGHTRLVELTRIPRDRGISEGVRMLAKLEGEGPGGSVKDRAAWGMLEELERTGAIADGRPLVEATSGNTGIALAMVAARRGIHMTLIVPPGATRERVAAMQAYGAEVIQLDPEYGIEDCRRLATRMAAEGTHRIIDQFNNPANREMHFRTTGPEVFEGTDGAVTHFVSAMGTTGTISGAGRYLKSRDSAIQVVGTQPAEGDRIPGIRKWSEEMTPGILDRSVIDRIERITRDDAIHAARALATREGILAGMSSGGVLEAALRVASELDEGTIVSIVCDRGDRYLSEEWATRDVASTTAYPPTPR